MSSHASQFKSDNRDLQPTGHIDWSALRIMLVELNYQFLYHLIDIWLIAFQ